MSTALRDPAILARDHNLDHDKRGPEQLAEALESALDEVFPIPLERLSRAESIKLAVSGA